MKNLILSADKHDTIYKRCIGPHLAKSFEFQTVGMGTLLLNPYKNHHKQIKQQTHQLLSSCNCCHHWVPASRSYKESHLICWHAWPHLQKMWWSHLANSLDLQVVGFGTSSLNSQTIHTWNHHKQIQEQTAHVASHCYEEYPLICSSHAWHHLQE